MITENQSFVISFQNNGVTIAIKSMGFHWLGINDLFIYSANLLSCGCVLVLLTYGFFYHTQFNFVVIRLFLNTTCYNNFLIRFYFDIRCRLLIHLRWLCTSAGSAGVEGKVSFTTSYDKFSMGVLVDIALFNIRTFNIGTCILWAWYLWRFTIGFYFIILPFISWGGY